MNKILYWICFLIFNNNLCFANDFSDLKIYTENNPPYVTVNEKNEVAGLVGEKVVKA